MIYDMRIVKGTKYQQTVDKNVWEVKEIVVQTNVLTGNLETRIWCEVVEAGPDCQRAMGKRHDVSPEQMLNAYQNGYIKFLPEAK